MNVLTTNALFLASQASARYKALKLNMQNILFYLAEVAPNYTTKKSDGKYMVETADYLSFFGEKLFGRFGTTSNPKRLLKKGDKGFTKGHLERKFNKIYGVEDKLTKKSYDYRMIKSYLTWASDVGDAGNKKMLLRIDKEQGPLVEQIGDDINNELDK